MASARNLLRRRGANLFFSLLAGRQRSTRDASYGTRWAVLVSLVLEWKENNFDVRILLNRIHRLVFLFAVCFIAWFYAAIDQPLEALSAPKKTVLVLYGEEQLSIPANRMTEEGLRAALSSTHAWDLEVFSEYLDLSRFPAPRYGDDIVRYLRAKYGTGKPDVLIVFANTTLQFVLDRRNELFPGVPIVFTHVDHREVEGKAMPPKVTGLWMAWDYQRTLELALQLQPETREVVCVSGTGEEEAAWNKEARKFLEGFITRLRTRWLDELPLQTVLDEVARLPPDSVVLYIPMLRDGAGQSVSPFEVARQLAEASRVPVYGLSRPQLEQGIVGGALLDFSEIGRRTAALALRALAGEKLPPLSRPDPNLNPVLVNWQALKKWHVSPSRIPAEATVLYREPTLWEQHPRLILATGATLLLQSGLIVGLLVQRSRRKKAEDSLRESEERMTLATQAASLGIWVRDLVRDEIWASDKWRELFGFEKSERLDVNRILQRLHPEDRDVVSKTLTKALAGEGSYETEYRVVLPDGRMRWIASRGSVEFDAIGKPVRIRGVSIDITARKLAEEAAHELSGRLIYAQEAERTRLARELHDDLSQSLALHYIELEMFGQSPPAEPAQISGRMQEFAARVQRLSSEVHRLSHELHPAKLERLGLVAAVREFCKEFAAAHDFAVEFTDRSVPQAVPRDTALCFYRIAQEALHNVAKHSGATATRVELVVDGGELRLTVDDNGVGFDPQTIHANGSLGLVSMSERARFVHGRFSVESRAGKGTTVTVRVPINAADDLS
jgi:PAS domain S-box-containing protein